jgi:hypothetical protein
MPEQPKLDLIRLRIGLVAIGFSLPIIWFFVMMMMFTAPDSSYVNVMRWLMAITCPPLLLQPYLDLNAWYMAPFLNSLLYYIVARAATGILRSHQA